MTEGGKKATIDQVAAAVTIDSRWATARIRVVEAQHIQKLCEAVESSFRARKDMLCEIMRDRRKEREGQLRILEQQNFQRGFVGAGSGG
jgi:hypothetical protein